MVDFEVLVGGVLCHPVAVEHPQSSENTSGPLLGHRLQAPGELELVDSVGDGLTVGGSLGHRAFTSLFILLFNYFVIIVVIEYLFQIVEFLIYCFLPIVNFNSVFPWNQQFSYFILIKTSVT